MAILQWYNICYMKWLYIFTGGYLGLGGIYFLQDFNYEFVIYVAVIIVIFALVFFTLKQTQFPLWSLWLLSIWGLMHVLGGAIETKDGVLFAYRIYPFLDAGGDMYILKYDQVVHTYLYGLTAIMSYQLISRVFGLVRFSCLAGAVAVLVSLGISALNEIMEFLIAVSLERNGVGGYENAMLDLIFNLGGALVAMAVYRQFKKRKESQDNPIAEYIQY